MSGARSIADTLNHNHVILAYRAPLKAKTPATQPPRLTPGQAADTCQLVALVDQVWVARPSGRGRPRMRLDHLTGDKAYSSRANRQALRARRIPHTTPERDDQKANRARKGTPGGRPPRFDRQRYKRRNQVERSVNRLKGWRRVATRYDKLACRYQATVTIADIFIWLRAKPDQPRGDPGTHALELIGYDPQTGIFPSTDVLRLLADAAAVPVRRPQRPRDITAAYAPQIQPFFTCPRFVYGRFASARRDGEADAMLLGRRTYDEFATWWPSQGDSTPIARLTNAIPKLVVTSDPSGLTWGPVAALGSDPVAAACRATTDVRP